MYELIRDARSEGESIGASAVDALLFRHDELKGALRFLISIHRSEAAVPENIWDRAERILNQETGDEDRHPRPEA